MMTHQRLQLTIQGAVQGVGFRPFIFRLATRLKLRGWVSNDTQGVVIEVEGGPERLNQFLAQLQANPPVLAEIETIKQKYIPPLGEHTFTIRPSQNGPKTTLLLPDVATCADCLRELFNPSDRRYRYPFINCTHCGPRYSIIRALPYDRGNTAMASFHMCPNCLSEYQNPLSRRFHAQPIACPTCGPIVEVWHWQKERWVSNQLQGQAVQQNQEGIAEKTEGLGAIGLAAVALRQGLIVAVKGVGGFHLLVDARNSDAVKRLRTRKKRPNKPFALMYPSLERVKHTCEVSELEAELLQSPKAPIVLLQRRHLSLADPIADEVAPGCSHLGVLLPYTPIHHLLMADLDFPIVATSGNLNGAPISFNVEKALDDLKSIADLFLIHNRPILHPIDDSVVQVINGQTQLRRRARGYAPLPLSVTFPSHHSSPKGLSATPQSARPPKRPTILAVGSHLKNTIALSLDDHVFMSQHLGDLDTVPSIDRFQQTLQALLQLYECQPNLVACDAHPDYASTQAAQALAQQWQVPLLSVQHHYAHVLACMAEHHLEAPVLGIAWDGAGYGLDGTVWGGEFLRITSSGFERVGYWRPFFLPGGDQAAREPRRTAMGLLYTCFGGKIFEWEGLAPLKAFSQPSAQVLQAMLDRSLNTPLTSSVGRFFDAIASLTNLMQNTHFEGQAAMALESILGRAATEDDYPFHLSASLPFVVDWEPMLMAILADIDQGVDTSWISTKFHNTLVEIIVQIAYQIGEPYIVLTGGCFQNQYLSERAIHRLQESQFRPYWHQQVPTNDGGIALGQIMAAHRHYAGRFPKVNETFNRQQPFVEADSPCA
ncbi:carbamoyltransferase HypF [Acaryochloris sp. CCMEE 5410]|uniref:carbamoyltransferase HypF n=1 Tax=Acaryochloris sp. CCMEE 5410 TaxID=310037 RepID=UPI000248461F|nr:carbamoyltransferase HypF [Acaryochloris sp. CCMEE 5410]